MDGFGTGGKEGDLELGSDAGNGGAVGVSEEV